MTNFLEIIRDINQKFNSKFCCFVKKLWVQENVSYFPSVVKSLLSAFYHLLSSIIVAQWFIEDLKVWLAAWPR